MFFPKECCVSQPPSQCSCQDPPPFFLKKTCLFAPPPLGCWSHIPDLLGPIRAEHQRAEGQVSSRGGDRVPVSPALPNRLHNGATAFGVSLWRSAGALVFNARAEVLLLKRGPTARTDPGCWYSFPPRRRSGRGEYMGLCVGQLCGISPCSDEMMCS